MKKINQYLMAAAVLTCSSLLFTACSEHDNPANGTVTTIEPTVEEMPTDDQMDVSVTHSLPTAVMGKPAQGSTGEALVRRLATTTTAIGSDTRMVLLQGSDFSTGSPQPQAATMRAIAEVYMLGGYIVLERPTLQQLSNFMESLTASGEQLQREDLQETFVIPEEQVAQAAGSSLRERMQARLTNITNCSTRADQAADGVCAEMVIFDGDDCFYMEPLPEENAAGTFATDAEGRQLTETVVVNSTIERNAYQSGQLADAIAEWLNQQEAEREQQEQQAQARTRDGSTAAINELMEASETFTFNGQVYWRAWNSQVMWDVNRLQMTIRTWGVHNMQTHRDYYLVKQDVTMKMGRSNKTTTTLFYTEGAGPTDWWKCLNYPGYNAVYGSFFSKYTTSMELAGTGGKISCVASKPEADNTTSTESIQLGNSSSASSTIGTSLSSTIGFKMGFQGLSPTAEVNGSFTAGISASAGYTNGSSFSISGTKTHKDISVKKNSSEDAQKVEWVYTGRLPKVELAGTGGASHEIVSDILVSDLTMHNEACWMVDNPKEQYTLKIHSVPETAAILLNYDFYKMEYHGHRYENCVSLFNNDYQHTLIEPNRAEQTWRMNIIVDEWSAGYKAGAQSEMEKYISKSYPDLYRNVFTVADKTPKSLQVANIIINHAKRVFDNQKDILQGIARSYGVEKFTITWRCDDPTVTLKEGYTVEVQ